MFFTLAVSADTPARCAALTDRARIADPSVLPVPGPAAVVWRSPDGRAALLHWGLPHWGLPQGESGHGTVAAASAFPPGGGLAGGLASADEAAAVSHGGTIWAGSATPGSGRAPVYARTSVTRVDPVYVAEVTGAAIVSDRATWAAWTASRLDDHDPLHVCALLNPGFPLGSVTPFRGVSALPGSTTLHLLNGQLTSMPTPAEVLGGSRAARGLAPDRFAAGVAGPGAAAGFSGPGAPSGRGLADRPSITLRARQDSGAARPESRAARQDSGAARQDSRAARPEAGAGNGGTVSVGLAGLGLAPDEPDTPHDAADERAGTPGEPDNTTGERAAARGEPDNTTGERAAARGEQGGTAGERADTAGQRGGVPDEQANAAVSAQNGPAQRDPARAESAQAESAQSGPAQAGMTRTGPGQADTTRTGPEFAQARETRSRAAFDTWQAGFSVSGPASGVPGRSVRSLAVGAREVAEALVAAVAPLRGAGRPVELSLTGGKDSRLIAAALVAAGVPVAARTHGFADHPDVVTAAEIARRLGIEHIVRTPAAPGQQVDVLARIRGGVLVADGMLSAFENVGRPDPALSQTVTAGGHGGELLRGGYAETAGRLTGSRGPRGALDPLRRAARSAELLRRLTTRHLGLLRRGPALSYVASLGSWTPALTRHPLQALDDFYLVNRAGRWSAAARQAYLLRERLAQPLFDDRVVLAARTVPLADRVSGALSAAVFAELSPALADVPLAGKPPAPQAQPPAGAAMGAAHYSFDWRRQYGETIATFLRGYILDLGPAGGLFDVVSRPAAEKLLTAQTDRTSVWALASLACLLSGDYRHARASTPQLPVA